MTFYLFAALSDTIDGLGTIEIGILLASPLIVRVANASAQLCYRRMKRKVVVISGAIVNET